MSRAPRWAAPALVALLGLAAYLPVLRGGFVWDDDLHITRSALNVEPGGWSRIWTSAEAMQYYPLTFTAFRAERAVFGLDPRPYHALNVFLHISCALWLALLLKRLRWPGAWWAAALFAVHPLTVETVAWATELKNLLCLLFALASLDRWLAFGDSKKRRDYAWSLAAYAACLLSKTAACLLPFVFFAIDWARNKKLGRREALRIIPFVLLGGFMGIVTIFYERYRNGSDPAFALSWIDRPLLAGQVFWFYLSELVLPIGQSFVYKRWTLDPASLVQWLPLFAAAVLGLFLWRRRRSLGRAPFAAYAVYLLLLFPVLGLFDVFFMRFSYVADHFAYFAMIPVLALAAAGLPRALLAALVLACAGLTFARVPVFRDSETLWRDVLAKNPDSWMAWDNLAVEELAQQRWTDAAAHAERAVALLPGFGVAWFHLGVARWNAGAHDAAAEAFARSLAVDPRYKTAAGPRASLALSYLGLRALERKDPREAVERFRAAAEAAPGRAAAWFNLARALSDSGRRAEAVQPCARGLALAPDAPEAAVCRSLPR